MRKSFKIAHIVTVSISLHSFMQIQVFVLYFTSPWRTFFKNSRVMNSFSFWMSENKFLFHLHFSKIFHWIMKSGLTEFFFRFNYLKMLLRSLFSPSLFPTRNLLPSLILFVCLEHALPALQLLLRFFSFSQILNNLIIMGTDL